MNAESGSRLPEHIAIIMDGNGRWAENKQLPRQFGHKAGVVALKEIVKYSGKIGIKTLTVYAFSTENWTRPFEEVDYLINYLLIEFLKKEIEEIHKNNVRIKILGDIKPFLKKTKEELTKAIKKTQNNTGLIFNIALNYGGKDELVHAFKCISEKLLSGSLILNDINEELISNHLYTAGGKDPDLIIRTGGEKRISNFLIWQSSYSELYFTDIFWPDFKQEHLQEAINEYQERHRSYGSLKAEEKHVKNENN